MASDDKTGAKKPNPLILVAGLLAVLVILGAALFFAKGPSGDAGVPSPQATAEAEQSGSQTAAAEATPTVSIDVNAALSDRILGNASAPVKISEHSSFTCGHCGKFHKETFKKLKEEYVDTGKAYIVFSDFPLNAPAVHASMVARCLPHDKYFDFVQALFETQEEWAYESNYLDLLKARAGDAGLDEAHFQACVQNTDLQAGIVNRMKGVQAQWNISSTPSFVLNNRTTVSGALPYEEFKKMIDAELGARQTESAPAATEEAIPSPEETVPAAGAAQEAPAAEDGAAVEDEATPDPTVIEDEATPPPTTESEGAGAAPAQ